jgi:hypothetical protein
MKIVKFVDLEHGEKFTDLFGNQWIRHKETLDLVKEGDHLGYCINSNGQSTCYGLSVNVYRGWEG